MGQAVLVIESDEILREALCSFLRHEGYDPWGARDGAEGLAMAREIRPGAIIVGTINPVMSSWELLSGLDDDPDTASIPRLLLIRTALGDQDDDDDAGPRDLEESWGHASAERLLN